MVSAKGKEKVTDGGGKGKRKWSGGGGGGGDDDKTGRKRKNRGVLQFFEDVAYQVDEDEDSSDDSLFDDDFYEDEFSSEFKVNNEPGKVPPLPLLPKEEEMSEEELERMLEERYKPGAGFVTYAEDGYEHKNSIDRDMYVPSAKDPTIWKVKCMVGRERYSTLCLMQKYADLGYLGTKLQIISACALDHVKGFIFIEAEKQNDIYEACKGLSTIYSSRVTAVPSNEISRLLSVRSRSSGISEGMWARVKNGRYKGDLAQVVAVNDVRKKVTVKLIPRIDLKSLAEKFGGGIPAKRTAIPAQRLISSSELEEFRPLIQFRRDRDTNQMFEVLDGMMLKDGYLYKKISIDSLSFWGIMPTEDELLKFEPSKKDESTDVQWLSQLFGEKKKKEVEIIKPDKGGGKSEGSSSACVGNNFELHDLVFFGRKDFGVVIGSEKDDSVKIIKEGSEGPTVVTVKQSELKNASFDKKLFSVLDQHSNTLTVNDNVRVLDGPLKDRQGIIKKIYKGILFLFDESEQENNGYICVKAQLCEKVNLSGDASDEKSSEPVPPGIADLTSSPKSPLSPDKGQERDNKSNFTRDDNAMFSVGQSLRIRVGPLKGYLCRVLAVRRSDITVKLDSQHKILTVKSEHLSEVRGRNSAIAQGEDSGSVKPFDFLGAPDGTRDWMDGAALSTEDNKWNAGGSTERSSWSALPSSNSWLSKESGSGDPADDDANKGAEDSWQLKETPTGNSSWGAAAANTKKVPEIGGADGWGQHSSGQSLNDDSWGRAVEKWSSGGDTSASKAAWGQSGISSGKQTGGDVDQPETSAWKKDSDALGKSKERNLQWENSGSNDKDGGLEGWGKGVPPWGTGTESQIKGTIERNQQESLGNVSEKWSGNTGSKLDVGSSLNLESESGTWGNAGGASSQVNVDTGGWMISANKHDNQTKDWVTGKGGEDASDINQSDNWNKPKSVDADSGLSWHKQDSSSSWGKLEGTSSWGKQDGGSSWSKRDDGSSWNKQDGGLSLNKPNGESSEKGGSLWSKHDAGSSWNKPDGGSSWKGESSWNKSAGKSSWGEQTDVNAEDKPKGWKDQNENPECSGGDQGFGGWKRGGTGNRDDTYQEASWGRSKTFDAGRGSGGRRGRGGGRGSASNGCFKCGESGHMARECPQGGGGGGSANNGCFKCGESGHMARECPQGGGGGGSATNGCFKCGESGHMARECPQGGRGGGSASNGCFKCGESGHMARECPQGGGGGGRLGGGGGGCYKCGEDGHFARDCPNSNREEVGAASNGLGSWDKEQKPNENNKSSWSTATTSLDGNQSSGWSKEGNWGSQKASKEISGWNQSSGWSKEGNWGSQKASEENSGWNQVSAGNGKDGPSSSWKGEKNINDGSSASWGQSNWSKSGTSENGGNHDTTWGSKSNWNSGSGFGGRYNQDETSTDGGGSGSWGGGGGGRGDRGGFRGRGGSDRGGFGGRGGSGRGRFGGRGSDRGGYGGRGGFDRDGFRGRGGFRGSERGDWNNRDDNSNPDKSRSWSKGSNNDGEGWKSGGSWNQRENDNNLSSSWSQPKDNASQGGSWNQRGSDNSQHQSWNPSWNQPKGDASSAESAQAGEWSKANDSNKDAVQSDTGASGWGSHNPSTKEVSVGWGKPSARGGWNNNPDLNQGTLSGNANNSENPDTSDLTDLGQSKGSGEVKGPSDAWGKAAASSWEAASLGNRNSSGNWNKSETTDGGQTSAPTKDKGPSDSCVKATTSSWGNGSGKGGW